MKLSLWFGFVAALGRTVQPVRPRVKAALPNAALVFFVNTVCRAVASTASVECCENLLAESRPSGEALLAERRRAVTELLAERRRSDECRAR